MIGMIDLHFVHQNIELTKEVYSNGEYKQLSMVVIILFLNCAYQALS
jgi:hypothetical protein